MSIKKYLKILLFAGLVVAHLFPFINFPLTAEAAFNGQLNYQGKLTNTSDVAVSDGSYNMEFRLYTSSTGGSPIWIETLCYSSDNGDSCAGSGTDSRVTVTNGLFSVLLGAVSSTTLSSINFNQTLYLGVNIGGTGSTPTWDGEMTPRKKLGAVSAAFEALKLDGLATTSLLRSDTSDSFTSGTLTFDSGTILDLNGALNIATTSIDFDGASTNFNPTGNLTINSDDLVVVKSTGNIGIGTTSPYARLSVWGNSSTANLLEVVNSASTTALSVSSQGFGTTTVTGLNINGSATTTSNVGINLSGGCFAVNNTCVGGGSSEWTDGGNLLYPSETGDSVVIGSSTLPANALLALRATSTTGALIYASSTASFAGNFLQFVNSAGSTYLSVASDGTVTIDSRDDSAAENLLLTRTSGNLGPIITLENDSSTGSESSGIIFREGNSNRAFVSHDVGGSDVNKLYLGTGDYSAANADLIIDSTGYIGIGTTSPYAALSVVGEVVAANFTATSTTATSTFAGGLRVDGTTLVADFSSNKVGILTASPGYDLDVAAPGESGRGARISSAFVGNWTGGIDVAIFAQRSFVSNEGFALAQDASGGTYLNANTGQPVRFRVGNSDGAILDSSLRFGIGTTSPYARLSVWGNSSTANLLEVVNSASTTALSVSSQGFGTTTVTGLNINGSATTTSNVGINLSGGCFAVNNTCVGGGSGATTYLGLTDTPSSFTAGAIPYTNSGATALLHSSNLVFTGNNLGISSSTPFQKLSIDGGVYLHTASGTPATLGGIDLSGPGNKVIVAGKYAYLVGGGTNTFFIVDISNPRSPATEGQYNASGNVYENVFVSGKYAYTIDQEWDHFRIFDISNPGGPTSVGSLSVSGGSTGGFDLYVSGKYAFLTARGDVTGNDFKIIDVSNPASPVEVGGLNYSSGARGVFVAGRYAYVNQSGTDIDIIDISIPTAPTVVGSFTESTDGTPEIYVSGKHMYRTKSVNAGTCSGSTVTGCEFAIIDVSNPASPTAIAGVDLGVDVNDVRVLGRYAYIGTDSVSGNDLRIYDVSDPNNIQLVGGVDVGRDVNGIYVDGKYIYAAVASDGGTGNDFIIYDGAGIDSPAATIGVIATNQLNVTENAVIGNHLSVQGINIGSNGLYSAGTLAVGSSSPLFLVDVATGRVGVGTSSPMGLFSVATTSGINAVNISTLGGVVVGNPTGGDKGYGTINAQAVYDDNTLLTDWVFDYYFDGSVGPDDVELHGDYQMMTIEEMTEFMREERHLPTIIGREEWKTRGGISTGALLTQIWETVETQAIYISELNNQLDAIQGAGGAAYIQGGVSSTISNADHLEVRTAEFSGIIEVRGPIYLGGDSVGQARILTGATSVRIDFEKPYLYLPIITATPVDSLADFRYAISNVSPTGFEIKINQPVEEAITFNWHAFGSNVRGRISVSNGTVQDINIPIAGGIFNASRSAPPAPSSSESAPEPESTSAPSGESAESEPADIIPPVDDEVVTEPATEPEAVPSSEVPENPETEPVSEPASSDADQINSESSINQADNNNPDNAARAAVEEQVVENDPGPVEELPPIDSNGNL